MSARTRGRRLPARDLEAILDVTSALAAPFDLKTMLAAVVAAAKQVLHCERGSVWLHDAATDELVLEVATGIQPIRVRSGAGLAGACAKTREIINVPDCYADPRFDAAVDRASGYRTRCMLTLPLVDHRNELVGVMQLLNKTGGSFDEGDEALAIALAAQCAVALQRVRMTEAVIEGERMRQSLRMARDVQMATLPAHMPLVDGYDVCGTFLPAELTGGDTFDVCEANGRLLVVLADATGHGIAPALSVTQMQAMLRMAVRLGADLATAYRELNDRLAETLPADRFITAFIGLLDPATHRMTFHSGGQGPILHFRAADARCERHRPTSFPLGAMRLPAELRAVSLDLAPGDVLLLVSDGVFEYRNDAGDEFGEQRVVDSVLANLRGTAGSLQRALLDALKGFAGNAPQEDDITIVVVKRDTAREERRFARSFASLPAIVDYVAATIADHALEPSIATAVDFAIEELFTNMVKYSNMGAADVGLWLAPVDGGLEVVLTDDDVEPFDVTRSPDADTDRPIEHRSPGGLGLHLVRRLVDSLEYGYDPARRRSRIRFTVTAAGQQARAMQNKG